MHGQQAAGSSLIDPGRRPAGALLSHSGRGAGARCHSLQFRNTAAAAGSGAEAGKALAKGKRRGVVILPGLGNNSGDYDAISADLQARGLAVATARVTRPDWLRNAAGLTTLDYWRGTLQPMPTVNWYMERISEAMDRAAADSGGGPVTLLARSAGGWLSRVFLLEVCGSADVWGDGITPVACAHLEGAKQITLEGVYHSPLGATLPSPDGLKAGRPWYGSTDVVDRWVAEVTRDASELAGFEKELGEVASKSSMAGERKSF